jgi:hypothetical protein
MEPLDLSHAPPRGPREKLLGLTFLPRTIDKMRAQLPGGNLSGYVVDMPRGLSAFLLKRVGVDGAEMQAVVASASDEAEVLAWFAAHADLSDVAGVNAKLESLTIERAGEEDRALVYRLHPGLEARPDLVAFYDIFEFDDARAAARAEA